MWRVGNNLLPLRREMKSRRKMPVMALIKARHGINKRRRRRRQLPLSVIRAMCDDKTEEFIIITRRHLLGMARRKGGWKEKLKEKTSCEGASGGRNCFN